jgi:hypothetical protein
MALMDDPETYCRDVEAYLCRKNDGHLVRIVGPAFEQVRGWAARGIPLKVVLRGVDRYFERYYAKGPRRRPVRVEFCEADVLDVFDEWRRSVGLGGGAVEPAADCREPAGEQAARPRESLATHLEKVVARLTTRRGGADRSLDAALDAIIRELDTARAGAKGLRGERRDALLQRLRELDGVLLAAAREGCDAGVLRGLASEAETQLAPFRDRMAASAYAQSHQACLDRLVRERAQLPTIAFD